MDALERDKIRIYLATEQGLETYEIAERLGLSRTSVNKYARQGREALASRERSAGEQAGSGGGGADPGGPRELLAHGV
ncbi:sigma factor-like helix-turn-helix DNA-binding protein [Streptomyces sp. t39]|uniref:sigma factor-like helix-turn-helix DNA-binding protein n=1 Tax=Streptomyces sp. t39 TaxID=1828156 RepID=UPI003966AE3C